MKRLFLLSFILLSSLCAGVYTFFPSHSFSFGSFSMYIPEILHDEQIELIQKNKILFVGDVMLARNVERLMDTYGAAYPFLELQKPAADTYVVGNFEASIPKVHVPTESMKFSFSVAPKYLAGVTSFGFSHFGLANNHSFDFGSDDFRNTEMTLSSSSITVFGNPKSFASSSIPLIHIDSKVVALIGVFGVNVSVDEKKVAEALTEAAKISDVQVIFIHWGEEYQTLHNQTQENLAHSFIDAGADIIIGHHPHVVQDIEKYKNGIIFYSLGNFIFDQYFTTEVQEGLAVELAFSSTTPTFTLLPITSIGSRSVSRYMAPYERDTFLLELGKNSDAELKDMIVAGVIKTNI